MSVADKRIFKNISGCSGKMDYPSLVAAQKAADSLNRRAPNGKCRSYHCPACGGFHIGRERNSPSKKSELNYKKGKL